MNITRNDLVDPAAPGWEGETPYFLVINTGPTVGAIEQSFIVDLDHRGWHEEAGSLMRDEAEWLLVAKRDHVALAGNAVIALRVLPGEQPYYTKKIVGIAYGGSGELWLYGIGKKRLDGHVDRLWILPNGIIVPGDDGELFADRILRAMSTPPLEEPSA